MSRDAEPMQQVQMPTRLERSPMGSSERASWRGGASALSARIRLHLRRSRRHVGLGGMSSTSITKNSVSGVEERACFVSIHRTCFSIRRMSMRIGSYPRSYYEAAINAGRILVSGEKVECEYKIKGGDELTHAVHRHEPAVGLADLDDYPSADRQLEEVPPVQIVHEDDSLLVVDKPATLPIHPCGGYNFNSLFEILARHKPDEYGSGRLFTVHRLDRLTSGLVLIAKSSALARSLGKCIMERDGCEKVYLARVKGKFPLRLDPDLAWKYHHSLACEDDPPNNRAKCSQILPPCRFGEVDETLVNAKAWNGGMQIPILSVDREQGRPKNNPKDARAEEKTKSTAGLGYWMTDGQGCIVEDSSLQDLIDQCKGLSTEEMISAAIPSPESGVSTTSTKWLNFSCPCRIASHKNGVCEAGDFYHLRSENDRKGIKPAQTSFALISYDESSDTSLVVAKPVTGRTHQIRLHLQKLGHPIANDHCYGGELWFGDEEGKRICGISRAWLDRLDRGAKPTDEASIANGDDNKCKIVPENSTNADTPATEAEIYHAAAVRHREEGESMLAFIEKTCVWCARCRGVDNFLDDSQSREDWKLENDSAVFQRTLMEYLVRSQGIWLHSLQYSFTTSTGKTVAYRTNLPSWAT
ncbi:hypothetical protein ACHAWF_002959 [Thalassiosira exigua]